MKDPTARLLLHAWLHDPPDKALDIPHHVSRATEYLGAIIDLDQQDVKLVSDVLASAFERSPVPYWDDAKETLVPSSEIRFLHLLGISEDAQPELPAEPELPQQLQQQQVTDFIRQLAQDLPRKYDRTGDEVQFLSLWRWLPQKLAELHPGYSLLPADTRVPDHTIWQHMDTVAALAPALEHGQERAAFLSFSVGPVQSFIASARSLRDLWTGSMILSYLTFQAMTPVLEQYGPTAIIYPVLRGNPLLDVLWLKPQPGFPWLLGQGEESKQREELARRLIPCLPNRFVAVVSRGPRDGPDQAEQLAQSVREKAEQAWFELSNRVHNALEPVFSKIDRGWDQHWLHAIENQFDFRTVVLPWHRDVPGKEHEDPQAKGNPDRMLTRWLFGDDGHLPEALKLIREFAREICPRFSHHEIGRWQLRMELLGRVGAADKLLRKVPQAPAPNGQWVPPKCSMTGQTEAMGPTRLQDFAKFWQQAEQTAIRGVRIRRGERLGSVALVKRFAGPVFFVEKFQLEDRRLLRMADTATVAARCWLERAKQKDSETGFDFEKKETWADGSEKELAWSGHWLHWHDREEAEEEEKPPELLRKKLKKLVHPDCLGQPPIYYAVLLMDGDRLGQWLQGKQSPPLRHSYHPKLIEHFKENKYAANGQQKELLQHPALDQRRPVTPAFHMAISEALANFSLHFVPQIVQEYQGQLVYAGGDDVLALLPLETVLACAEELQQTYRKPWEKDSRGMWRMLMGSRATMSAAVVVAHYKDDLRSVLQAARDAEKAAKNQGRDVLQLVIRRRSGEHSGALCPWEFVEHLDQWRKLFSPRLFFPASNTAGEQTPASDRWVYQLHRVLKAARELPLEAQQALLRRQLGRAEKETRRRVAQALRPTLPDSPPPSQQKEEDAGELLARCFEQFTEKLKPSRRWPQESPEQQQGNALEHFVLLWQAASFLARGRDR